MISGALPEQVDLHFDGDCSTNGEANARLPRLDGNTVRSCSSPPTSHRMRGLVSTLSLSPSCIIGRTTREIFIPLWCIKKQEDEISNPYTPLYDFELVNIDATLDVTADDDILCYRTNKQGSPSIPVSCILSLSMISLCIMHQENKQAIPSGWHDLHGHKAEDTRQNINQLACTVLFWMILPPSSIPPFHLKTL